MIPGKRVLRTSGKISYKDFPITSCEGRRVTRAIQAFQPKTHPSMSTTTRPMSTVSKTRLNTGSDRLSNMAGWSFFNSVDKVVHDRLQRGDGGQIHEKGDEAVHIPRLDVEIDIEEQNETFSRRQPLDVEQGRA